MIEPIKFNDAIAEEQLAYIASTYATAAHISYMRLTDPPDTDSAIALSTVLSELTRVTTYAELLQQGGNLIKVSVEGIVRNTFNKGQPLEFKPYMLGIRDTPLYPSNLLRKARSLQHYLMDEPGEIDLHLARGLAVGLAILNYLEQLGMATKAYLEYQCYLRDFSFIAEASYTAEEYVVAYPLPAYVHSPTSNETGVKGYVIINKHTGFYEAPIDTDTSLDATAAMWQSVLFNSIVKPEALL